MNQSIESTLSILPSNKEQIKTFVALLINELEDGRANPLAVQKTFKAFEKVGEAIKSELSKLCLKELDKHPKGKYEAFGVTFETMEAGTKYDYSGCGDIKWELYKQQIEALTESLKQREVFLKALNEPFDIVDNDTGEVYRIHPPVKSSTTTIKTTF